jgi:hypothetical protein
MKEGDAPEAAPPVPPAAGGPAPPSREAEVRRRQRSRAIVMGLALAAFVILLYGITIARIGNL